MELRNLKTFHIVTKELNMTKASQILMYTQPTVTMHIQLLEKELNQPLFMRIGNKLILTPAGEILKKYSILLFEIMDDLDNELSVLNGPSGTLTIAASEYYCVHYLSHFFTFYNQLYPQVKLRIVQLNSMESIEKVLQNEVDLGIVAIKTPSILLEQQILDEERLVMVVATSIYKKNNSINDYPLLTYHSNSSFDEHIKSVFDELKYHPVVTIECGSSEEMVRRAVLNGTGVGFLGEKAIQQDIDAERLIPLHYCTIPIHNSIVYLKSNHNNLTVQSFVDTLKQYWNGIPETL
jgi:DNA-binding transcriptional LysR family regulator